MEWVETTGRTIAEALDAALDELGVNEDEVEYEVLEQPKAGFLGRFGGSEARIRARVRPISREKPGDRRRRRRDERKERGDEAGPRPERAPRGPGRAGGGSGGSGVSGAGRGGSSGEPASGEDAGAADEDTTPSGAGRAPGSGGGRRRRGRGGGSGGRGTGSDTPARSRGPGSTSTTKDGEMTEPSVPLEEQVEVAEAFTRGLVEQFGFRAEVRGRADGDDDVWVEIEGDELGVLIGPRGATLDALQELVKTAVQHRTGGFTARMHVDVGGYRARRHAALAEFARSVANTALETGRDQALEPMNSADRKVVHDSVADIEGVVTTSEGEEPRRRVVIRRA